MKYRNGLENENQIFVYNYFVMTLKVASLNSFFSKPLVLLFYCFVVVESKLF